jgi:peptidyl-prolyl cis-trans isomerase B (cyclophilin B)
MKRYLWLGFVLFSSILLLSCGGKKKQESAAVTADTSAALVTDSEPVYAKTPAGNSIVVLKTSKGDIEIEIYEKIAPNHGGNFIKLAKNGFYDGLIFHKVVADLFIESGDPSGTGEGGPGYSLTSDQSPLQNRTGYVGMLPAPEEKSNGSQFYILVADNPEMDDSTSCFGKVIAGLDVAKTISEVPVQKEKPIEPIKILEAYLKPASTPGVNAANDSIK